MRFRIDPREAERDPPPQPARPAPQAEPPAAEPAPAPSFAPRPARAVAPQPPPRSAAPAAAAAAPLSERVAGAIRALSDRRALVVVVALALLVGGAATVGAMYALDAGPFAYPNQYTLEGDEIPRGLENVRVTSEMRENGLQENPGELSPETFAEEFGGGTEPDRVYIQALAESAIEEPILLIMALQYADEDAAKGEASRFGAACVFGGDITVLRDGDVIVIVWAEDHEGTSWLPTVTAALKEQNGDLMRICG